MPRGQAFDGVAGKHLANPIPAYAEQAARQGVPHTGALSWIIPIPIPAKNIPMSTPNSMAPRSRLRTGISPSPIWLRRLTSLIRSCRHR